MIEVQQLVKFYSQKFSLNIDHYSIQPGECVGLVGNNGAGKTTLLSLILDLMKATKGEVLSKGEPVAQNEHWKSYTSAFLDEHFLIDFLTPKEYFEFVGKLRGLAPADTQEFVAHYSDFLTEETIQQKQYIRNLSAGNKSKIGIVAALMGNPELILLDEPFAHLDPTSQNRLKNILDGYKNQPNVSLIISSHDLKHVTEICSRITILHQGQLQKDMATTSETLKELERYFAV